MARYAFVKAQHLALLRAGLAVTAAGAVLGMGAGGAQAAPLPLAGPAGPGQALTGAVGHATAPVTSLQLDPLAHTGADPLDLPVAGGATELRP